MTRKNKLIQTKKDKQKKIEEIKSLTLETKNSLETISFRSHLDWRLWFFQEETDFCNCINNEKNDSIKDSKKE